MKVNIALRAERDELFGFRQKRFRIIVFLIIIRLLLVAFGFVIVSSSWRWPPLFLSPEYNIPLGTMIIVMAIVYPPIFNFLVGHNRKWN
ncbi:MAG: hypothetical protein LBO66_09400 [Deltaproteobacteria bacterium]|nr:hypothetical protein [Deltaproteobacteria bacterium]